jgi:hypothetical protein
VLVAFGSVGFLESHTMMGEIGKEHNRLTAWRPQRVIVRVYAGVCKPAGSAAYHIDEPQIRATAPGATRDDAVRVGR